MLEKYLKRQFIVFVNLSGEFQATTVFTEASKELGRDVGHQFFLAGVFFPSTLHPVN